MSISNKYNVGRGNFMHFVGNVNYINYSRRSLLVKWIYKKFS